MSDSLHRRVSQVSTAAMINWIFLEIVGARQPLKPEMNRTELSKPQCEKFIALVHLQEYVDVDFSVILLRKALFLFKLLMKEFNRKKNTLFNMPHCEVFKKGCKKY